MNSVEENNLKLTGNQIILASRPVSNIGRASSRCALLGRNLSRPMSAIPLLNLTYNEFETLKGITATRPWSADTTLRPISYFETMYSDRTTSGDSGEELEPILPSSNLLEEMLSEPLFTWKNGKRTKQLHKTKKPLQKIMRRSLTHRDNDTPSAGSDTSSSMESIPIKACTPIVETTADKIENEYDESIKAMALIPGLKTKPPLPRKPDSGASKLTKKNNDLTNCEVMANNAQSLEPPPFHDQKIPDIDATKLETEDPPETKVQNWFEEQQTTDDIKLSELNTDLSIKNLKAKQLSEHSNFSESESDAHSEKSKTGLNNLEKTYSLKRVNFEEVDVRPDVEKRKSSKNFIKENIKLSSKKTRKKVSDSESEENLTSTSRFAPSPMKSFADFKEPQLPEVESWMSTEVPSSKSPFLDCLNKVNELHETCQNLNSISETEGDEESSATTHHSDSSTYDDIVSILQTLEEEDKKSQNQMKCMKKIVNDELSSTETDTSGTEKLTFSKSPLKQKDELDEKADFSFQLTNSNQEEPFRTPINKYSNLNDIFEFLDQADKSCSETLACAKDRIVSVAQVLESNLQLDTMPKLEELLEHSNVELSNYVIQLNLRLKEKSSSVNLLQKELSGLREHVTVMTKNSNEIIKTRLKSQKENYESAVKRHQKFIDQLISDKKTLNQQCEGLVNEIKTLEDRYRANLKAAEHRHKVELQKVKEMHIAGEKMRKERWIDTKTQKIKELTIKGIEPELERMNARHQQELMDVRALHKQELEELDLRATRKLQQHCEALREQLSSEQEKALTHERELLRQRYERMVASEEQNFQEQRRKLLADHAKRVAECDEREHQALVDKDRCVKQVHIEFEDKLQTAIRKHNVELNLLKEKTEMEMETFRNNYKKQIILQLGEKEALIREKCRKDRDREIEAVIERLELEASETKLEMEQTFDNRIRRLKEKYEKEIKDLEESEREVNKKYSETKTKLTESEELIIVLKATINQLDAQLSDTKMISDRLSKEREHMKEVVKNEMAQDISVLENTIEDLKVEKEKELQRVYARVRVAVARKDETISELNVDKLALQQKCAYLENMLEQQRKEYLIK